MEDDIALGKVTPNIFVQCALLDIFAMYRCLSEAKSVFESMGVKDFLSCNDWRGCAWSRLD
jgi:pentatricopeptide repeat protein